MVNGDERDEGDPERALALSYAPASARAGVAALLALDERLGRIVASTTEPVIGQMRLTWWFEALERLDTGPAPAEPLLRALAANVLPAGVQGSELAAMVDGWEPLILSDTPDLQALARARGGALFRVMARVLGASDPRVGPLGEGWALAQMTTRWPEAARMATLRLDTALSAPWPRALRALGALGLLARADLADRRPGSPARVGRLLLHRLTGR